MQAEKEMAGCHVDSLVSSVQRGIAVNGTFGRRWLTQPAAAVVLRRKVTHDRRGLRRLRDTRSETRSKTRSKKRRLRNLGRGHEIFSVREHQLILRARSPDPTHSPRLDLALDLARCERNRGKPY